MSRLESLHDAGVSIWLDTLSRKLLETGEFARLIEEDSVTGATSNPTIFANAITGSDRYDGQLHELAESDVADLREAFFALALDDVRAAADALRPPTSAAAGATASCRLSARPISRTTPRPRSPRRSTCGSAWRRPM
jgi:transaldolase